ncbi:TrbC/VirB2 family protein [Macrococcus bovicus]|uniref:TrbC/VirB2 family protein n=1 Tax=Macrococcus bovicus TaxID=69968 RepID=UPI0025A63AF8|nr:TrbC/VirB2 family protein [Macrococcus bovicus]WJP96723.1 TrbC/VirB2 family protein [Macrococcus bovicus]
MTDIITHMGATYYLSLLDFLGFIDLGSFMQYNDAVSNIVAGLKKVSLALKVIGIAVAAVYIALAGYQFMWGGPNGSQTGKQYLLNAAIGIVLIYGASMIADWVATNMATGF